MSFYEIWIATKYGPIFCNEAKGGFVEVHVATVPVMNGVAIGMGDTRETAIMDLYEDLRSTPIEAPLKGYWRDRRANLKPPSVVNLEMDLTRLRGVGGDA